MVALLSWRATVPEVANPVDWEAVIRLAVRLDVAPVLYARLRQRGTRAPQAAADELRASYVASAARNMRLLHERDRVMAALSAAGTLVVPIKGASLAEELYGDAALRPMADVDLWVRREDTEAARSAVGSLGYAVLSKTDRPLALQDALLGETQMVGRAGTLVELHWNIFPGEWLRHTARVDQDEIWTRTRHAACSATGGLSPEDTVVHLCVHLAVNHQMSGIGLRTLVDLDHARRKWSINWAVVAQRARQWRMACATWLVLDALAELFGDPRHELPLPELAPRPCRRRILHRFASPVRVARGLELSGGPRRFLFLLLLVDRPVDAARLAWRALWPDPAWLTLRYESPRARWWRVWLLHLRHLATLVRTRDL